jgi:hypothetical protein
MALINSVKRSDVQQFPATGIVGRNYISTELHLAQPLNVVISYGFIYRLNIQADTD